MAVTGLGVSGLLWRSLEVWRVHTWTGLYDVRMAKAWRCSFLLNSRDDRSNPNEIREAWESSVQKKTRLRLSDGYEQVASKNQCLNFPISLYV